VARSASGQSSSSRSSLAASRYSGGLGAYQTANWWAMKASSPRSLPTRCDHCINVQPSSEPAASAPTGGSSIRIPAGAGGLNTTIAVVAMNRYPPVRPLPPVGPRPPPRARSLSDSPPSRPPPLAPPSSGAAPSESADKASRPASEAESGPTGSGPQTSVPTSPR